MYSIEKFKDDLLQMDKDNIASVVLYGSAVSDDTHNHFSDTNVLVVLKSTEMQALKKIAPVVERWSDQHKTPPLVMSVSELRDTQDVFAIEFSDIQAQRRVIFGDDIFAGLQIDARALRHQLEFELRSKILLLRKSFFESVRKAAELENIMMRSYSSFSVLAKTCLRLLGQNVPTQKRAVWAALAAHVPIDATVIDYIHDLRTKRRRASAEQTFDLFGRYMGMIEALAEAIDKFSVTN